MSKTSKTLIESRVSVNARTAASAKRVAEAFRASLTDAVLFFARGVLHRRELARQTAPLKTRQAV